MLREISQTEKDKHRVISFKCGTNELHKITIGNINTASRLMVGRWERGGGLGGNGEGIRKYKLAVTTSSRGCEVQHGESGEQ